MVATVAEGVDWVSHGVMVSVTVMTMTSVVYTRFSIGEAMAPMAHKAPKRNEERILVAEFFFRLYKSRDVDNRDGRTCSKYTTDQLSAPRHSHRKRYFTANGGTQRKVVCWLAQIDCCETGDIEKNDWPLNTAKERTTLRRLEPEKKKTTAKKAKELVSTGERERTESED